jgi:hypothetical protein
MDPWPIVELRPREIIPVWIRVGAGLQNAWRWMRRWLSQFQHSARR